MRKFNSYEWSLIITECLLWLGFAMATAMILSPFYM